MKKKSIYILFLLLVIMVMGFFSVNSKVNEIISAEEVYNELRYEVINNEVKILGYTGTPNEINIPATILNYNVVSIENGAFSNCKTLEKLTMPNSIMSIGNEVFSGCTKLNTINISSSVKVLSYGLFDGCTQLSKINIPSSVNELKSRVFYNCSSLNNIKIPSSVICIRDLVFFGTKEYTNQSNGIVYIDSWAVGYKGEIRNLDIKNGIRGIADNSFWALEGVTSAYIPNSVRVIGKSAFEECYDLEFVNIPNSVGYIGENAFLYTAIYDNKPLGVVSINNWVVGYKRKNPNETVINVPTNIIGISAGTFKSSNSLVEINLPSSLIYMCENAFTNCTSLNKVIFNNSVTRIDKDSFAGCSNLTIYAINQSSAKFYAEENLISFVQMEGVVKKGDVDGNGLVSTLDLVYLQNKILGISNNDNMHFDVNLDGTINVIDIMTLMYIVMGII